LRNKDLETVIGKKELKRGKWQREERKKDWEGDRKMENIEKE
jgi:hypothetical protein